MTRSAHLGTRQFVQTHLLSTTSVPIDYIPGGGNAGRELVKRSIAAMIAGGCDEIVLEAEVGNTGALALYQSLGFIRDKRLHRWGVHTDNELAIPAGSSQFQRGWAAGLSGSLHRLTATRGGTSIRTMKRSFASHFECNAWRWTPRLLLYATNRTSSCALKTAAPAPLPPQVLPERRGRVPPQAVTATDGGEAGGAAGRGGAGGGGVGGPGCCHGRNAPAAASMTSLSHLQAVRKPSYVVIGCKRHVLCRIERK